MPARPRLRRPLLAVSLCLTTAVATAVAAPSIAEPRPTDPPTVATTLAAPRALSSAFHRTATYPVFENVPDGVDPTSETVAEISAVTPDGRTLAYTDAAGKRVGLLDIGDPAEPRGLGSIDLTRTGDADDQPTSVAIRGGHLLVVIDESGGDFAAPSGRLDVYRLADRTLVRSLDLGGQPDSIALNAEGTRGAIAIENQRDEDLAPEGGEEGDLPQPPAGFLQVLDLTGAPRAWQAHPVRLTRADGSALPAMTRAGIDTPTDPEPEYVSINAADQVALTLQENNGVVVVDLATRKIKRVFSTGIATTARVDTADDGRFDATGSVTAPREPDAIAWVDGDHVATANEGDWKGGTRNWTIFDVPSGRVSWDSGNTLEQLATRAGLHDEGRADNKGVEPEGLAIAEVGGTLRAFVGSERSNFVAVYSLADPLNPLFEQMLPTTNGPEGILPVPGRALLALSSETDDAEAGVRASVALYSYGEGDATFPQVQSAKGADDLPIGWGALSGLSADPRSASRLYAVSDSAYATGRIYRMDVDSGTGSGTAAATITRAITVTTPDGATPELDLEGVYARPDGGFWLADEGATGPENALLRVGPAGVVRRTVPLPDDVAAGLSTSGIEGVTGSGSGPDEVLYVALQRPLAGESMIRIGRYAVASGEWTWFGYQPETTEVEGDWVGLSEITLVDTDTVAVVERDKLNGPGARIKRVYAVTFPRTVGDPAVPTPVGKRLRLDLLPTLRAGHGWTQEKVEGLTVGGDGRLYLVTDNDGLDDATGETVFADLGPASQVRLGGR